jgi:hypothetical protein
MSFFATKLGQAVIIAGVILLCWLGFSRYYEAEGKRKCEAAYAAAAQKRDNASIDIGKKATAKAEEDTKRIDKTTQEAKTEVRTVYRDVLRTVPLEGSCVHPLDPRVQSRIEQAIPN